VTFPGMLAAQLLPACPADAVPVPADYDGDGITDMALKGSNGIWYIDLGANGFGGRWDLAYPGYGSATAVPVPGDYDGDGKADLAIKDATGMWGIDYASNYFGVFDVQVFGYGGSTAVPVPADYDGDGRTDLSVKDSGGTWYIDYAANGFVGWNEIRSGYGNATAVPVPADYDGDGRADLSVKDSSGTWFVDYAQGGFGGWNASYGGRGGSTTIARPGDYDHDGRLDLSVKDANGIWLVDFAAGGFTAWNLQVDNPRRVLIDFTAPWIDSMEIFGPNGRITPVNGQYPVRVGVRYTVALHIDEGNGQYTAGVEINPDLHVPASLNVQNRVGSTGHVRITAAHTRRFAFTPSQPGSYPLGFMMRDIGPPTGTGIAFNKSYGIRVACTAARQGLYGVVTQRVALADGRFAAGQPIAGAFVVAGSLATQTAADGSWNLPTATGGPWRVRISNPGHSPTVAVNVTVPPGSGVQIDTPLEEPFTAIAQQGMDYTTYIDYSRGRTILHTVRVDSMQANIRLATTAYVGGNWLTLRGNAIAHGSHALATINGGYFDVSGAGDAAVGYFYAGQYVTSRLNLEGDFVAEDGVTVLQPALVQPLLTVTAGAPQKVAIVPSEANFFGPDSGTQWTQIGNPPTPIWDTKPRDGISDVQYAMQASPYVVRDGMVIWRGVFDGGTYYQMAWARTAVGVAPGAVFLVVADGEGVNGGQGATFHQLGEFFRDVLGARTAINFDGGLSTEMVLFGAGGWRKVNVLTGEDSSWDVDPSTTAINEINGGPGSVFDYLMAGT
jgi:hypothetical protein